MNEYLAVIERANDGTWSAYVPDLPGCTSFGSSREEAARNVHRAIDEHIAALRERGDAIPEPTTAGEMVREASREA